MLTIEIKEYIDKSVLCWLATSNNNQPNVSPKQVFTYYNNSIIIANIASPKTVNNIKNNENICISFIDILVQKGYQLYGKARIIDNTNIEFSTMKKVLAKITTGEYPFNSIVKINIEQIKQLIDPKYILYPGTTEKEQIESAKKQYSLLNDS